MDELAKQLGFKDAVEMNRMIASVDLARPGGIERFKRWQESDGTKAGLERLLNEAKP